MKKYLLVMGGTERGWSRHNDEGVHRDYDAEADRLIKSAEPWGLECRKFNNEYILNSEFYPFHKDVMDKISFGFTFKVIIFWNMLKEIEENDILLFVDSNHVIAKDPSPYYEVARQYDICAQDHIWVQYPNKHFTRRDTFVNMNCDSERYWNSLQMQCNIIGIKKCEKSLNFVKEWLDCSLNYGIMFGNNVYPNFEGFKAHRHDQSIFSILIEKYSIPYINRTQNVWLEFVIPEQYGIEPKVPVDNRYRMEEDRKENI